MQFIQFNIMFILDEVDKIWFWLTSDNWPEASFPVFSICNDTFLGLLIYRSQ